jgi:hypothetical protein
MTLALGGKRGDHRPSVARLIASCRALALVAFKAMNPGRATPTVPCMSCFSQNAPAVHPVRGPSPVTLAHPTSDRDLSSR